jgi:hypothetical protein
MADASTALGAPEVAGAWVNRRGMGKRTVDAVGFGQFGGGERPTAGTPNFGGFGYLALSATDLVVVKGKKGLVGLKMSDDVVAKVPRTDVASVKLGEGKITAPMTITFGDGGQWDLEVARAHRGAAERVVAELGS